MKHHIQDKKLRVPFENMLDQIMQLDQGILALSWAVTSSVQVIMFCLISPST